MDGGFTNAKIEGNGPQVRTRRVLSHDGRDVGLGQFRISMSCAPSLPALSLHVRRIVGGSSEEQVLRVYAAWVVAVVANKKVVIEPPMRECIADAVRLHHFIADFHYAVATIVPSKPPLPTSCL